MSTKIYDFLPSVFKVADVHPITGKRTFLPALYKAIDAESYNIETVVKEANRQLFLATADGKYLIRLGAQEGFTVPQQTGLGVEAFRQIVPAVVSYPKQVADTIVKLIEIFYNKNLISPSFISTKAEPYSFTDQDVLLIQTDKGELSIGIFADQVANITNVSASEYASVINSSQSQVFADVYFARETASRYVRLTTNTYGAGAYLQVTGGTAQNTLQFPPIVPTLNAAGTTFNVTKTVVYTDVVTFQWDGVGTNPRTYLIKKTDIVTFTDLVAPFDVFNGTFEIIDSGIDYFIIRNERFLYTSGTVIQPYDKSIIFTINKKATILQNDEYCLVDESNPNAFTVFVAAVPSAVKRNVKGGSYLHGWIASVLDFSRNSITVKQSSMESIPVAENAFYLSSRRFRVDYVQPYYKTNNVSSNGIQTDFVVESGDDVSVLPFTTPTTLDADPLFGDITSNEMIVNFTQRHGLLNGFGFTLSGIPAISNLTSGDLNTEQYVRSLVSKTQVKAYITNGNKKFAGIAWTNLPDVYQMTDNLGPYDFYLEYPTSGALTADGWQIGLKFRIYYDALSIIAGKETISNVIFNSILQVVEMTDTKVYFNTGIGIGTNGKVLNAVNGIRDGWFGGSSVQWFFDKTTTNNLRVTEDLTCTFQNVSTSNFLGSYVYDTEGTIFPYVLGNVVTSLKSPLSKGDNVLLIQVDSITDFPLNGYLYFDYGTDFAEGPIKYINTAVGQINVDPSYVFKKNHAINAKVQLVRSINVISLDSKAGAYPLYVTGVAAARNFFFDLVKNIIAAGVFVNEQVNFPELKFSDTAIKPYE